MNTAAWAIAALALALALLLGVASAGAGWYLLVPTVNGGGEEPKVGETAPLGQWNQRRAFETVRECEAERTRINDAASERLSPGGAGATEAARVDRQGDKAATFSFKVRAGWRYADTLARCIASDDPRLGAQR